MITGPHTELWLIGPEENKRSFESGRSRRKTIKFKYKRPFRFSHQGDPFSIQEPSSFEDRPISVVWTPLNLRLTGTQRFFVPRCKMNFYKIVFAINSYFTKIKAQIDQNRISDILSFLMENRQKIKWELEVTIKFKIFINFDFHPYTTWLTGPSFPNGPD